MDICGCTSPPKGEKKKNWEKYEEEIKKIGIGNLTIYNGTTANCRYIPDCSLCDFSNIKGCDKKITEWLYQEAE